MAAYALASFREATLAAAHLRFALRQLAETQPSAFLGEQIAGAPAPANRQAAGGEGR
jgi:hypothetical protein